MPAPNKNITEILRGGKMEAAPLAMIRQTLIALCRMFETYIGPLDDDGPKLFICPIKQGDTTTRAGISKGSAYFPSVTPGTTGDLSATSNFVARTQESSTDDIELWDISTAGLGMAIYAGRNDDGKPILILLGGGSDSKGTEQYQEHQMVTSNTAGWEFPMSPP